MGASAAALVLVAVLSLGVGPAWLSPGEVVRTLLGGGDEVSRAIVLQIRLPRIALGMLVGGALGVSGAAMQGLFRNPMADPYVVGVSPGAALGAVLAIASGASFGAAGLSAVPPAAFCGGLAAAFAVVGLSRRGGRFPIADLLLVGLAVGAFAAAVYSFVILTFADQRISSVLFWLLGSLAPADWRRVVDALPYLVVSSVGLLALSRRLDILSLGEEQATYLGVGVERVKLLAIGFAALGASAAVAVSGVIGFIGLIVPHVGRILAGPRHALLLPVSGLWGAAFLVAADDAARTAIPAIEIPVGIITALCGAPFFVYLLSRSRRRGRLW
ncbi:FecCD family ABC transporter permease [Rubrobacter naiadicus]|uniref:FecCD family ABC transporter permease n=1 Tax=Rubrobacter naiadicus TaxID=1392641 RepID=UPI00235FA4BE|nr:iron ABC transporter permease [Rubrobacter naiadicus]